jgi:hypothetical protein
MISSEHSSVKTVLLDALPVCPDEFPGFVKVTERIASCAFLGTRTGIVINETMSREYMEGDQFALNFPDPLDTVVQSGFRIK